MDQTIRDIIDRVYIKHEHNGALDQNNAKSMAEDLSSLLRKIEGLNIKIELWHDDNFSNLEYGKDCAVAFDIIISKKSVKHELVIEMSKLGKYIRIYWRKLSPFLFQKKFIDETPKDWDRDTVTLLNNTIQEYGIRILNNNELSEEFEGIRSWTGNPTINATVDELLFCFDGYH
ncbi:MAG: hypothetical protein PHT41_02865 [Candidatus Omnitrophica bacterium]|nr:hypothetical protein [Candidatus Omnitrophota bacterium]MDD5237391.1 hypothetical protein [Candidatus Omnitrophota bacterium]